MLSICVPIYNFDVRSLVSDLSKQINGSDYPIELILIDDASSVEFKRLNKEECNKHIYIELPENIGRSRIRNLFLQYANFENLLFLDCDVGIGRKFLENYLLFLRNKEFDVIFGGLTYNSAKPPVTHRLRWHYGTQRESVTTLARSKFPYKYFKTCNFVIKKEVLNEIKFDEKIIGYGHEDTLFAIELEKHNKLVLHINNEVSHDSNESNEEFLEKTQKSADNLAFIYKTYEDKKAIIQYSKLLSSHFQLRKFRLINLFHFSYSICEPIVNEFLRSGTKHLLIFDLYKLNCMNEAMKRNDVCSI